VAGEPCSVQRAALDAAVAAGHPLVDDHNRLGAVGAGVAPMNARDGVRISTALAYLAPARTRTNLTLRADALRGARPRRDVPPPGRHVRPGAVVDAAGRVHGVEGIRIGDASVMPNISSANTHVPTLMVAEKLSAPCSPASLAAPADSSANLRVELDRKDGPVTLWFEQCLPHAEALPPQMWIDDLCGREAASRSQRVEARHLEPCARRLPLAHAGGVEGCVCFATVEASQ